MKFISRLLALEEKMKRVHRCDVPGTTLTRVLMDGKLANRYDPNSKGNPRPMWCLALGAPHRPKEFFYSASLQGCIRKAEKSRCLR